jgi:hypothetical protein
MAQQDASHAAEADHETGVTNSHREPGPRRNGAQAEARLLWAFASMLDS